MIVIEPALYIRIEQLSEGPRPLPLRSGFSSNVGYRTLGFYTASETAEAYLILSNDREEIWFISNRHVRTIGLFPAQRDLRLPLPVLVDLPSCSIAADRPEP